MSLGSLLTNSKKYIIKHAPEILTGVGTTGVIATGYLSARAGMKAARILDQHDPTLSVKEKTKLVWKCYIPAAISGAITTASIVGSTKSSNQRTATAVAAYSMTEKAFSEYKEKVVEQLGEKKDQSIKDSIAQDKVGANTSEVIFTGRGQVLCYEMFTGRYFKSDMETLRRANNEVNALINKQLYTPLYDFYDLIDLTHTDQSDKVGWDSDRLLELEFSTVLSPEGEPCLAFSYSYIKPL